jgi:hypothetical protein
LPPALKLLRHRREHRRTADLVFQLARCRQQRIADLFGFQALARIDRQQLVVRIGLQHIVTLWPDDWR